MYSGDYPQPLIRKQEFHLPIVGGYTTGRLSNGGISAKGGEILSVSGYQPIETKILVENTGTTTISLTVKETDSYISGPRSQIGGTVSLVPRGTKYLPGFFPTKAYLEISSPAASSNGTVRMQIEGQLHWSIMAFDKTETIYPASLRAWKTTDPAPFPQ